VVETGGGDLRERVGELERHRMAHLEGGCEVERFQLLRYRFGDLAPPVARVDAPEARHRIQDLPAVRRPVMHAGGLAEQTRIRLEVAVRRERHPVSFKLGS
jgi:hypothetical protein